MFRAIASWSRGRILNLIGIALLSLFVMVVAHVGDDTSANYSYGLKSTLSSGEYLSSLTTTGTPHDVASELRTEGWAQTRFTLTDPADPSHVTGKGFLSKKSVNGVPVTLQLLDRPAEGSGLDVGPTRIRWASVPMPPNRAGFTTITCDAVSPYDVRGTILFVTSMAKMVIRGEIGISQTDRAGACELS